jgi:hypothetical protein
VDVSLGYIDGWTNAQAFGSIAAEPDGFGPAWEGTFQIATAAYKWNDYAILDFQEDSAIVYSGAYVSSAVHDQWGGAQCTLSVSGVIDAQGPGATCYDSWEDSGPCP